MHMAPSRIPEYSLRRIVIERKIADDASCPHIKQLRQNTAAAILVHWRKNHRPRGICARCDLFVRKKTHIFSAGKR